MSDFHYAVVDPRRVAGAGVAIVVPARNEADRIASCLESLAQQDIADRIAVYLCVNNTCDDTAEIALASARERGLALVLAKGTIGRGGVGQARRIGHALAYHHSPRATSLLSTDADCVAEPAWARILDAALRRAPAVLGRIDNAAEDRARLPASYHACVQIEAAYMGLSAEFEDLLSTRDGVGIGLNTAGGANMGIRADAYLGIGGFHPLATGEDRDLVCRLLRAGHHPIRASDAIIYASMRPDGRAPRGMASAIALRSGMGESHLDTALAPFAAMLARHLGRSAVSAPMRPSEALRDMPDLRNCVEALRTMAGPVDRRAYLAALHAAPAMRGQRARGSANASARGIAATSPPEISLPPHRAPHLDLSKDDAGPGRLPAGTTS